MTTGRSGGRVFVPRPAVPPVAWTCACFVAAVAVCGASGGNWRAAFEAARPALSGAALVVAALAACAVAWPTGPTFVSRRPAAIVLVTVVCVAFYAGWLRESAALQWTRRAAVQVGEGPRAFTGRAVTDPARGPSGWSVDVRLDRPPALVRVMVRSRPTGLRLGHGVAWRGAAKPLDATVPRDREAVAEGLSAFAYPDGDRIEVLPPTGPLAPLYRWRSRILDIWHSEGGLQRAAAPVGSTGRAAQAGDVPGAALLTAAVFGDRSGLDPATQGDFRRSGLAHVLGASGAYAALLAAFVGSLGWSAGAPAGARRAAVGVVLTVYTLASGLQTSVLRATLCVCACAAAWLAGRRVSRLAAIALAAAVVAMAWPATVQSVGFRLSFSAALAAAWWAEALEARLGAVPRPVRRPLAAASAVGLGLLPLLAGDFSQVSLVAPLTNLAASPLLSAMTGLGTVAAALATAPGAAARAVAALALAGARGAATGVEGLAGVFARPGWAAVSATGLPVAVVPLYYLCVEYLVRGPAVGAPALAETGAKGLWPRAVRRAAAAAAFVLAVRIFAPTVSPPPRLLEIRVMDVGQGDAILLRTPEGHSVLVDGGPSRSLLRKRLAEGGVNGLDLVVVTHPHTDHYVGLQGVLSDLPVGEMWQSPFAQADGGYAQLLALARTRGIRVRAPPAGSAVRIDRWLRLEVLAPGRSPIRGSPSDANNNALVLMAACGSVRILLAADIQQEQQAAIAADGDAGRLGCAVYKVAHHGSAHSLDGRFLAGLGAGVAVVSVGQPNRYGHPSPRAMDALAGRGMRPVRTDESGTVVLTTDGARIWMRSAGARPAAAAATPVLGAWALALTGAAR